MKPTFLLFLAGTAFAAAHQGHLREIVPRRVREDDGQYVPSSSTLSKVLSEQSQLTNFTSYVNQYPGLFAEIQALNVTILAPSDEAFANYWYGDIVTDGTDQLEDGLSYHVLDGIYSESMLRGPPQFIPTLLTNPSYTNVTGGQRVEATSSGNDVVFYSAVKLMSTITTPDIFYNGGVIHVVDAVLVPPLDGFETLEIAQVSGFLALMDEVARDPKIAETIGFANDVTLFVPNSSYLAPDEKSQQQQYAWEEYGAIQGEVAYSSLLTDGTTLKTVQGGDLTITVRDGSIYVNEARITEPDFLMANGVFHIIDKGLDPYNASASPSGSATAPSSATSTGSAAAHSTLHSGLSSGAKAGIGVGVAVGGLAVIGLAAFFLYKRRGSSKPQTAEEHGRSSWRFSQGDKKTVGGELEGGEGRWYELKEAQ